jgi:hypothetical protein
VLREGTVAVEVLCGKARFESVNTTSTTRDEVAAKRWNRFRGPSGGRCSASC